MLSYSCVHGAFQHCLNVLAVLETRLMETVRELADKKNKVEKLTTKTKELQAAMRTKKPLHELEKEASLLQEENNRILTKQGECEQLHAQLVCVPEVEKKHQEMSQQLSDLEEKHKEILALEKMFKLYEVQRIDEIELKEKLEKRIADVDQLTMENLELEEKMHQLEDLQKRNEKLKITAADHGKLACEVGLLEEAVKDYDVLQVTQIRLKAKAAESARLKSKCEHLQIQADKLESLHEQANSLQAAISHEQELLKLLVEEEDLVLPRDSLPTRKKQLEPLSRNVVGDDSLNSGMCAIKKDKKKKDKARTNKESISEKEMVKERLYESFLAYRDFKSVLNYEIGEAASRVRSSDGFDEFAVESVDMDAAATLQALSDSKVGDCSIEVQEDRLTSPTIEAGSPLRDESKEIKVSSL